MIEGKWSIVVLFLLALVGTVHSQLLFGEPSQEKIVIDNLLSQPVSFTENRGQWDEKVLFKAEAGGATFWFCRDEVVYQFMRDTDEIIKDEMSHSFHMLEGMSDRFHHPRYKKEWLVIRVRFEGANPEAEIIRGDRLSHNSNYFIGADRSRWATDVPNYSSITYRDIYPGIDLRYHGDGLGMKYDFIVNAGADISQIRVRYDGVDDLFISNGGDLQAQTRFGLVYEQIPEIYQEVWGRKREVSGGYIMREPGVFGFAVEAYDPSLPLIIDPELIYSTYLGGNDSDGGLCIAVDASGCAYVTGVTWSTNFPTQNPYQVNRGADDVFVTKLSSSGNTLIYSTYLGGSSSDQSRGIAVDASGCAYVTGETWSTNFPTQNPYQRYVDLCEVFVTKLSSSGNTLVYSTYLGSESLEGGLGIAVDASGCAYVTGLTESAGFPIQNPYQDWQGYSDAFVTKFSPSGDSLVYSTHLGGDSLDYGNCIAVDASGCAYVTGYTLSTNFPTQNPYQGYQGGQDAFVTKLSSSGNTLGYSTYLGGNADDEGWGIAVDASGCAYVTGGTSSSNFPTQNPYQGDQGAEDVFVTKFSSSGNTLVYSTHLGGDSLDYGLCIAVDAFGCAYVTGLTSSTDFPTQNPYQGYQGDQDLFVTKLSASGNTLVYGTYLGGNDSDQGHGIAVDASGSAYVVGPTHSTNFPTQNPYQGDQADWDAFVAKFEPVQTIVEDYQNELPRETSLIGNYPNPFNSQTRISYSLVQRCDITIDIFDILGVRIARFSLGNQDPGSHTILWDAGGVTSGVYFCRLTAGDRRETKRMLLLK